MFIGLDHGSECSEVFTIRKDYDLVFLYREAIPIGPPIIERLIHGPAFRSSMTSTMRSFWPT